MGIGVRGRGGRACEWLCEGERERGREPLRRSCESTLPLKETQRNSLKHPQKGELR